MTGPRSRVRHGGGVSKQGQPRLLHLYSILRNGCRICPGTLFWGLKRPFRVPPSCGRFEMATASCRFLSGFIFHIARRMLKRVRKLSDHARCMATKFPPSQKGQGRHRIGLFSTCSEKPMEETIGMQTNYCLVRTCMILDNGGRRCSDTRDAGRSSEIRPSATNPGKRIGIIRGSRLNVPWVPYRPPDRSASSGWAMAPI